MDNRFRQEINGLDGLPPQVSWSKDKGWEKLNRQLEERKFSTKVLPMWLLAGKKIGGWKAIAAVIALALCSHIVIQNHQTIIDKDFVTDLATIQNEDTQSPEDHKIKNISESLLISSLPLNELAYKDEKGSPTILNDGIVRQLFGDLMFDEKNKLGSDESNSNLQYISSVPSLLLPSNPARATIFSEPSQLIFPSLKKVKMNTTAIKNNDSWSLQFTPGLSATTQNLTFGLDADVRLAMGSKSGKAKQQLTIGLSSQYHAVSFNENDIGESMNKAEKNMANGVASFITAGYSHNISKNLEKPFWVGIKAGYMIQNNTTTFDDKTIMLEMIVGESDSGKIKVSPQIYLTDNMKKVIPGLKIAMSLNACEKDVAI